MVRLTTEVHCTKNPDTREKTVNQYRLLSEVGRGTFSKVRWAQDSGGGSFAVKSFSKSVLERRHVSHFDKYGASTVVLKVRIQDELRILGDLSHRNIVTLLEVIDDPNHEKLYAIYEGLAGGQLMVWNDDCLAYQLCSDPATVKQYWGEDVCWCANNGNKSQYNEVAVFQESVAKYLFHQLLEGAMYLHEQGVIHKDLKPDNIMLSLPVPSMDPRFVRLLSLATWPSVSELRAVGPPIDNTSAQNRDSAINKPTEEDFLGFLNRSSFLAKIGDFNTAAVCPQPDCLIYDAEGTQQFSPPEVFTESHGGVHGKPRDMWSLGCILFTMFFGKCPFWADVNIQLQLSIMQDNLVIPSGVVSPQAEDLIHALVCKDPQRRLSVTAALRHPWSQGVTAQGSC